MFSVSLLGVELGGVDADHDELVLVFLLELGEVGQDVVAVDAAIRPEVEQDDLAAQLLEADRARRVEPADAPVEARRRPTWKTPAVRTFTILRPARIRIAGPPTCRRMPRADQRHDDDQRRRIRRAIEVGLRDDSCREALGASRPIAGRTARCRLYRNHGDRDGIVSEGPACGRAIDSFWHSWTGRYR